MKQYEAYLAARLQERQAAGNLRQLPGRLTGVDFCSNDYLGLGRRLEAEAGQHSLLNEAAPLGQGARLISGDDPAWATVEAAVAYLHRAPAALIFPTGFQANISFFAALCGRGDLILYDKLVHASIREGIRLSAARSYGFRHNDIDHLRELLGRFPAERTYVVVESIYSMDGDEAPLAQLADCCRTAGAALVVDEAHAGGIIGPAGAGLCVEAGIEAQVFARLITLGKGIGAHGAAWLGSVLLRDYLVNFAGGFIYSTAPGVHFWARIAAAYRALPTADAERQRLQERIAYFRASCPPELQEKLLPSRTPIQVLVVPGNDACRAAAASLQAAGLAVKAILHPTVAHGAERLRICLHAFNSEAEIDRLFAVIRGI